MYCYRCGAANAEESTRCGSCGTDLHPLPSGAPPAAASPTQVAGEAAAGPSAVELFIPYKNGSALAAYYLGVFSLLCGLLLGIPALVLGIMGLRFAKLHPEVRGKVHAWIGIVLGSLTTAITLTVIGLAVREFLAGRR